MFVTFVKTYAVFQQTPDKADKVSLSTIILFFIGQVVNSFRNFKILYSGIMLQ